MTAPEKLAAASYGFYTRNGHWPNQVFLTSEDHNGLRAFLEGYVVDQDGKPAAVPSDLVGSRFCGLLIEDTDAPEFKVA